MPASEGDGIDCGINNRRAHFILLIRGDLLWKAVAFVAAAGGMRAATAGAEELTGPSVSAFASVDEAGIPWPVLILNVASVICFALWWWWMSLNNRHTGRSFAAESSALMLAEARDDDASWKARALAAEARADKATALLKKRLMPQLARWMMSEFLQKLVHQRSDLVTSQQRAEAEVEELEQRLEKLHAPLEDRLKAYERRIADLERDLAAKGDENRELIRAKIDSARKRLESERTKSSVTWN